MSLHVSGPQRVRERDVGRPLSCLTIESILDGDETAASRGWQRCPGRRLACGVAGDRLPLGQWLGWEDRVQSCRAEVVGGDGGIGDAERGQGGLAGCPCLCLCQGAAVGWLKLHGRPVPLPVQQVEKVDTAKKEDP